MRHDDIEVRVERQGDVVPPPAATSSEPSLGDLFKRLTTDTGELIRQEAALAKAEMQEVGSRLAGDAAKVGVAAGIGLVGALSLGAFLVIALGNALGGAYWLSALIVGLVMLAVAAVMGRSALSDIRSRSVKPEQTLETLRADKAWASRQARELKQELKSDPTAPPYNSR